MNLKLTQKDLAILIKALQEYDDKYYDSRITEWQTDIRNIAFKLNALLEN